jgi:outer membrane protein insertion porin family
MADLAITSGPCRHIVSAVLLGVLGLGGAIGCRQMSSGLSPSGYTQSGAMSPRLDAGSPGLTEQRVVARAQTPPGMLPLGTAPSRPASPDAAAEPQAEPQVVEVRIVGARRMSKREIRRHIRTRAGRPFDAERIEDDVRRLSGTGKFVQVNPSYYDEAPGRRVVVFEVLERNVLEYVKYVGNRKVSKKTLQEEAGIKTGDAFDPLAVEDGRRRLQRFYREKGFTKAQITVYEGDQVGDRGVIYLINEGPKPRIAWTRFIGNTVASDAKLRTKIQSKPGFLWFFKGEVNRELIEEDRQRLVDYYRGLGYFRARVGHPILDFDAGRNWLLLTFVIDEGPRYKVRRVSFLGNTKFTSEELAADLNLKPGRFFNRTEMESDRNTILDQYGADGYILADVQRDVRFLEEPGQLDLVYHIQEGGRCRVGRIEPNILGDYPHTRVDTILNRISLHPGDIVDIRELRASERRLEFSGLFEVDRAKGIAPKIVVDLENVETGIAGHPGGSPRRGQSPDPARQTAYRPPADGGQAVRPLDGPDQTGHYEPNSRDGIVDLTVNGRWIGEGEPAGRRRDTAGSSRQGGTAGSSSSAPDGDGQSYRGTQQLELAEPTVIRGQYSVDAGQSVPPLRRPWSWLDREPPPTDDYPPPAESQPWAAYPPSDGARGDRIRAVSDDPDPMNRVTASGSDRDWQSPVPDAWSGSGASTFAEPDPGSQPFDAARAGGEYREAPRAEWPGVGASALTSSTYGSQPDARVQVAQSRGGPLGLFSPNQPPRSDPSALFGYPPDEEPPIYVPLSPEVYEARTGRLMLSAGVNSEAGVLASLVVDEQNFDWRRLPTSWDDIVNGTAWRGAGQQFRMEAVPGSELHKYSISFREPYWEPYWGAPMLSLGLSGYFYNRRFREWEEEQVGGRIALGYQFTHDLSATVSFRGAKIEIFDPIVPTPAELTEVLGENSLYGFRFQLTHDTRDHAFLPTEGHLIQLGAEQVAGTFDYTRGDIDFRRYFMLRQHPDGSGRHVLAVRGRAAVTSSDTPIYDHYYAGGFSTIRGFDFRGASPRDPGTGVLVGGHFMLLGSVEYMFPITADDNLRAVVFCDTGTVEPAIDHWTDRYRIAPGVGLRISIPGMGGAPIALDFAFPISEEPGDDNEVFSFFIGLFR